MSPPTTLQLDYPRVWAFLGAHMADWDYEHPSALSALIGALTELDDGDRTAIVRDLTGLARAASSYWAAACEQMNVNCASAHEFRQLIEAATAKFRAEQPRGD